MAKKKTFTEQEHLTSWKEALWAMWEEGFKVNPRNITLGAMRDMFMTGFDAGRSSFSVVPEKRSMKKSAKKSRKG